MSFSTFTSENLGNSEIYLTAKTVFSSKITSEKYLRRIFSILKNHPDYSEKLLLKNSDDFEVNPLPLGLRDLSTSIEGDFPKINYAKIRGTLEAKNIVLRKYGPSSEFETKYLSFLTKDICQRFSGAGRDKIVRVLSGNSYIKANKAIINLLLNKDPITGEDNLKRKRKVKDDSNPLEIIYFSDEEIREAEINLSNSSSLVNYESLNFDYYPFSLDYLLLSVAVQIDVKTVKKIPANFLDQIFVMTGDEIIDKQLNDLRMIAERDFMIIDNLAKYEDNINNILLMNGKTSSNKSKYSKIKFIYANLLIYFIAIITISRDLVEIITEKSSESGLNKTKIEKYLGFGDSSETDGYFNKLIGWSDDEEGKKERKPSIFDYDIEVYFRIPNQLFAILFFNSIKKACENSGSNYHLFMNALGKIVGYKSAGTTIFNSIMMKLDKKEHCIIECSDITKMLDGKYENPISYIYRKSDLYFRDGNFTIEPTIIVNAIANISSKKTYFDISDRNIVMDVDSLVNLIKKLTGDDSIKKSDTPYKYYEINVINKRKLIEETKKEIEKELDEKYGERKLKCLINLPPIPFDSSEVEWARLKCLDIEKEIKEITDLNVTANWDEFMESHKNLIVATFLYAESEVDNPILKRNILIANETFELLCENIKKFEIDDSKINKLKILHESLFYYSNLDKIKFEYKKFNPKLNSGISRQMSYTITKNIIYINGELRKISDIITEPNGVEKIINYFDKFFVTFVTLNVEKYGIEIEIKEIDPAKPKKISMIVTFPSTDDLNNCYKFRSFFYSIQNTDELLNQVKIFKKRGKAQEFESTKELSLNEIPDEFVLIWNRSADQNEALQGKEKEKTFKFYNESKGCDEKYPFYDEKGQKIIEMEFNKYEGYYREMNARNDAREIFAKEREMKAKISVPDFGEKTLKTGLSTSEIVKSSVNKWSQISSIIGKQNESTKLEKLEKEKEKKGGSGVTSSNISRKPSNRYETFKDKSRPTEISNVLKHNTTSSFAPISMLSHNNSRREFNSGDYKIVYGKKVKRNITKEENFKGRNKTPERFNGIRERDRSFNFRNRTPNRTTPYSRDRTPNRTTPGSRDTTPNRSTPYSRDRTPYSRDRTPASRDRTPASRDRTPASRDRTPASRDRTPASRDRTPTSRDEDVHGASSPNQKSSRNIRPESPTYFQPIQAVPTEVISTEVVPSEQNEWNNAEDEFF
jgi:hypothetical protein